MRGSVGISGMEQWGRRVQWRVGLVLFNIILKCLTGLNGVDSGLFKRKWFGRVKGSGSGCFICGLWEFKEGNGPELFMDQIY